LAMLAAACFHPLRCASSCSFSVALADDLGGGAIRTPEASSIGCVTVGEQASATAIRPRQPMGMFTVLSKNWGSAIQRLWAITRDRESKKAGLLSEREPERGIATCFAHLAPHAATPDSEGVGA